jgi:ketosteroid isomerase-like protein
VSQSIEELAGSYHQAWVERDPDAIVALHTEDSVFHMHGAADPAVGRPAIRAFIAAFLILVPDVLFDMKRLYAGSDHLAFEYDMSGTYEGTRFVIDGADVIAVTDGLVARKDTYFDAIALIGQIGPLPQIGVPA